MEAALVQQTILIADDEAPVRAVLRFALERAGYTVIETCEGAEALRHIAEARPDLAVLDVRMPQLSGLEVCRRLRQRGDTLPLLFLSSVDAEVDRIVGLELGADDYGTQPFSPREVVSRIGVVLRRSRPQLAAAPATPATAPVPIGAPEIGPLLVYGALTVDVGRHEARWRGQSLVLSALEMGLLRALLRRPGQVLSRDSLIDQMYRTPTVVSDRTVDSHIRKLRARLQAPGDEVIATVHGVGYRIGACVDAGAPCHP